MAVNDIKPFLSFCAYLNLGSSERSPHSRSLANASRGGKRGRLFSYLLSDFYFQNVNHTSGVIISLFSYKIWL